MKKYLPYLVLTIVFLSCKKEPVAPDVSQVNDVQNLPPSVSKRVAQMMKQPERTDYAAQLVNRCYPEAVGLNGMIISSSKDFTRGGVRYVVLTINYDRVSGMGAESGLEYRGRGQFLDVLQIFPNATATETSSYIARYGTSQGDSLIIDQHSKFNYGPDGDLSMEYNKINDRCK